MFITRIFQKKTIKDFCDTRVLLLKVNLMSIVLDTTYNFSQHVLIMLSKFIF